jgi:hypothetical protein
MKTYVAAIGLILVTLVDPVIAAAEEKEYPSIALPTKYPAAFSLPELAEDFAR